MNIPVKKTLITDQEVDNYKPSDKDCKIPVGEGLYILVRKNGAKVWQYPYRYNGKATIFTIGKYQKGKPGHVGLKAARMKRYEVRALLDQGIDPNKHKNAYKAEQDQSTTFETIAREWHSKGAWVPKHAKNILQSLVCDVFPAIGAKDISMVTRLDIAKILEGIEKREAYDVAKRVCQRCEGIFDYAISKGICNDNPATGRAKFVKTIKRQNRPHLKEGQLGEFLYKLDSYHGRDYIRLAMNILALTFVRPGELRNAVWEEFDFEKKVWTIPAERMKMKREHRVPLSEQVILLLNELRGITGRSDYLFPSVRSPRKPISDVTLLKLLKIMGYEGSNKIVPHGFRHTASTILNEKRFHYDIVERQLAHEDKNSIRGTYNHAEYWEDRAKMVQWYADFLDELKLEYMKGAKSSI